MFKNGILSILVMVGIVVGQTQFRNDASASYYGRGGNSDYQYFNLGFSTVANGDLQFGGMVLKDSEFLFAIEKNNSTWQGEPYENDQDIILKFDLWANGRFSPFLIAETSFDEARGIKDRTNFGLGFKYRIIGNVLSVSAAFLSEKEETIGKNSIYLYADYGDSLGVTQFLDNTDLKPISYSRFSIRPKLNMPIGENFHIKSEYYYKPAGDDILTHWKNTFTIHTAEEWLDIVIKYSIKNDSRPAPKVFMDYDPKWYTPGQTITFENPGNAKDLIVYDRTSEQSEKDGFGNYYIKDYKGDDTFMSIGLNISF